MTVEEDQIKLGRVGHYSYQQVCQTASICYVHPSFEGKPRAVNVAGYNHAGDPFRRESVDFGPTEGENAEFHLNADCPWSR